MVRGRRTPAYVPLDSDMVFLDAELFQMDSIAFNRQVADILKSGTARDRGPEMLAAIPGRFAPEFEYEEWAEAWRTLLHGRTSTSRTARRRRWFARAGTPRPSRSLLPVMLVDPLALDLRGSLIACFAAMGSNDAASPTTGVSPSLHMRDLGVTAPTYDEIVARLGQ